MYEDNCFSDQLGDLSTAQGAWRTPRLGGLVSDSPRLVRKAISKIVSKRKMADEGDEVDCQLCFEYI